MVNAVCYCSGTIYGMPNNNPEADSKKVVFESQDSNINAEMIFKRIFPSITDRRLQNFLFNVSTSGFTKASKALKKRKRHRITKKPKKTNQEINFTKAIARILKSNLPEKPLALPNSKDVK